MQVMNESLVWLWIVQPSGLWSHRSNVDSQRQLSEILLFSRYRTIINSCARRISAQSQTTSSQHLDSLCTITSSRKKLYRKERWLERGGQWNGVAGRGLFDS